MAGMGGSDLPDVQAEFNKTSFTRGVVGAARTQDPNTFNSQFFICFNDCTFLDGQYTVFGKVVEGMDVVDAITRGEPPATPDKIVSAKIENK
jgi:peptidylprolyl isomerase